MPKLPLIPSHVERRPLPPAGEWHVDSTRSSITFSGRANRFSPTVRAAFEKVRGGLHLAADPNGSRVGVCVDVRTVTTGNPIWDDMLRAADPFRAREHPLAHYASSAVRWTGAGFEVDGTLELAGALTPLRLRATVTESSDADASGYVVLDAAGVMDPRAARLRLDIPGGRLLVPREMTLTIAVVARRVPVTTAPEREPYARRFALAS